jgi:cysteine-rich repeat protein
LLGIPATALCAALALAPAAGADTTTTTEETSTTTSLPPDTTTTTLPPTTRLQCFRMSDPVRLKAPAPWIDLDSPQLQAEQCAIVGSFRLVCIPVRETITRPIQEAVGPTAYKPFTPTPLPVEEAVTQDRICYRIRCKTGSLPDPATKFIDEFGGRTVTKTSSYLLCGPAVKSLCGDGVVDPGEECDDGNTKSGDCCSKTCQLEAAGASCPDTDGTDCTAAQCDGAGTCVQSNNLPLGTTCAATGIDDCTIAACDGNGTCVLTPRADGLACDDTDKNPCTAAKCSAGACNQNALVAPGTTCVDTDNNPCTTATCVAGACDQTVPSPINTPCIDTDGSVCTAPLCDGNGVCTQGTLRPSGTLCGDIDGNACTRAACDTAGNCIQGFFLHQCPPAQVCIPATGLCQ